MEYAPSCHPFNRLRLPSVPQSPVYSIYDFLCRFHYRSATVVPPNPPVHLLFRPTQVLERWLLKLLGAPSNTKLCHGSTSIASAPMECHYPPQDYYSGRLLPCRGQTREGPTTSTKCLCQFLHNPTRDPRFCIFPPRPLHFTCPNHSPRRGFDAILVLVSRTAAH